MSIENLIELQGLTHGKHLIEIDIEQKSSLCSNLDECVVESKLKNEFECVKCKKIITIFNLRKEIYWASTYGQKCVSDNFSR